MSSVHVIYNTKGGSGKTTIAINLAFAYSLLGKKVLFVDIDRLAASTKILCDTNVQYDRYFNDLITREGKARKYSVLDKRKIGITTQEVMQCIVETKYRNLYILPSTAEWESVNAALFLAENREDVLRKTLDLIKDNFDIVLIDVGSSDDMLTFWTVLSGDVLLIPVPTNILAFDTIDTSYKYVTNGISCCNINPKIKLIVNRYFKTNAGEANRIENQIMECWPNWSLKTSLDKYSGFEFNDLLIANEEKVVSLESLEDYVKIAEELFEIQ